MTRLERALKRGKVTEEINLLARYEHTIPETILNNVISGEIAVCKSDVRNIKPVAIGKGLRIKVNANIGTSSDASSIEEEVEKAHTAIEYGADMIMDLSTGGDIPEIRKRILDSVDVPVGTVPIYETALWAAKNSKGMVHMTSDDIFRVIDEQLAQGVDFITVHCGVTQAVVERLIEQGRLTDIVSRGGAFIVEWMLYNKKENPLYVEFDRLLEIAKKYDATLSLGDGIRPGCLADATDRAQISELIVLGELVDRSQSAGVQVIVEGPGHVPINQIETNIKIMKDLCNNAPFYVLGPLVTDGSAGYDHITAAIGGAVAGMSGADFICYVTPAEHLCLPSKEDVKLGVIAARIAAHAADIARGWTGAREWDDNMSEARKNLDWEKMYELNIDPEHARKLRSANLPNDDKLCTMCGEFCAVNKIGNILGVTRKE
ncbi:MAG: phosphomethylpyrimidine synthase ThiC [Candidatus Latescibacteria bacterium]|nr:phosphomethylpyrimidine synthase ThiC [Candidatus Latescibacterota bacterium]